MLLRDRFTATNHVIPYDPAVGLALGDMVAAVLLQQLSYWTDHQADDEGWIELRGERMRNQLGVTPKVVRRARMSLEELGLIEVVTDGLPKRTRVRIIWPKLEAWWTKHVSDHRDAHRAPTQAERDPHQVPSGSNPPLIGKKEQKDLVGEAASVFTFEQVLSGHADRIPKSKLLQMPAGVVQPIQTRWAEVWGVRLRGFISDERENAWRRAVRKGVKPSDFAKAIIGMRWDVLSWPDRVNYCGWSHVLKRIDDWLRNYDKHEGKLPTITIRRDIRTRIENGVVVPAEYVWTDADEHMRNQGYRFDLETEEWRK